MARERHYCQCITRLVVDEVLPAPSVIVDRKFAFGEVPLAGEPRNKLPVQVCPIINCHLQCPVKKRSTIGNCLMSYYTH
jgi:hypothetical protein